MTDAETGAQPRPVVADEIVRLVTKYERQSAENKDGKLLRQATDLIVRARMEHFSTPDGGIDVGGHSYDYRKWMGEIYGRITQDAQQRVEIGNRLRYHFGQSLRYMLTEDELDDAGLQQVTLKDRGSARRARRTALVDLVRPGSAYTPEEAAEALGVMGIMLARLEAAQIPEEDRVNARKQVDRVAARLRDIRIRLV